MVYYLTKTTKIRYSINVSKRVKNLNNIYIRRTMMEKAEKKKKLPKTVTTFEENKEYLHKIFGMFRTVEFAINAQHHEKYNNTEIRLMNEIVYATSSGERLISTQLASRLGVTRSAISQIVAKLEKEGVLQRVDDDVDKKIAYVELTDKSMNTYKGIVEKYSAFVGRVIAYMGTGKMEKFLLLSDEFYSAVASACAECDSKKHS